MRTAKSNTYGCSILLFGWPLTATPTDPQPPPEIEHSRSISGLVQRKKVHNHQPEKRARRLDFRVVGLLVARGSHQPPKTSMRARFRGCGVVGRQGKPPTTENEHARSISRLWGCWSPGEATNRRKRACARDFSRWWQQPENYNPHARSFSAVVSGCGGGW